MGDFVCVQFGADGFHLEAPIELANGKQFGTTPASQAFLERGADDVGLVPLFGILYASYFSYVAVAPQSPELGAITAGAVAAALIGLAYVAPVAWISTRVLWVHRRLLGLRRIRTTVTAVGVAMSGLMIGVAYLSGSAFLMGLATASLTLSSLSIGSILGAIAISSIKLAITSFQAMALAVKRLMRSIP